MSKLTDMFDAIDAGDAVSAEQAFNAVISAKLAAAIQGVREDIAEQVFDMSEASEPAPIKKFSSDDHARATKPKFDPKKPGQLMNYNSDTKKWRVYNPATRSWQNAS